MTASKIPPSPKIDKKALEKVWGSILSEAQTLEATTSSPKVASPTYQSAQGTLINSRFEGTPTSTSRFSPSHLSSADSDKIKKLALSQSSQKRSSAPKEKATSFKHVFGLRMETLVAETLRAQRVNYGKVIQGHLQTIESLKTEISNLEEAVHTNTKEITELKSQLQAENAKLGSTRNASATLMIGGATATAACALLFPPAAIAMGIATFFAGKKTVELGEQQDENNGQISETQRQIQSLQASENAYTTQRLAFQKALRPLQKNYEQLKSSYPTSNNVLPNTVDLKELIEHDKSLIHNLESQISIFKQWRNSAAALNDVLGVHIESLQNQVMKVRQQVKEAQRELVSIFVDLVVAGFATKALMAPIKGARGAARARRVAKLSATAKATIMASVDLAHGDVERAVESVAKTLFNKGIIKATGSRVAPKLVWGALRLSKAKTNNQKLLAVIDMATIPLKPIQRDLIKALANSTLIDAGPLAESIAQNPKITHAEAAFIRSLVSAPIPRTVV